MKAKIRLIITMSILLAVGKAQAVDVDFYSDGVIEDGDQYNNVRIFDTPPDRTTVSMFGGSASFIQSYDSSILNMFGGTTEACAYNQSTINVSGGTVYTLNAYNSSNVNVFGGQVNHLTAYDTGTVNVSNNGIVGVMRARDSGVVNVGGGVLGLISASNFGTVNLLGGVVDDYLAAGDSGIINIYGYVLAKVPTGGHYGFGFVSGEWADRTAFNMDLSGPDTYSHINLITVIDAEIYIVPKTLNLASKGKWIMCNIKLPEDSNVIDVNSHTVLLQNEVPAEWIWFNEKANLVMAKFNRSELKEIIEPGDIELTVTGKLADGTVFTGTDTIKVIDKGHLHGQLVNSNSKIVDGIEYYIQTDKAVYHLGENIKMLYRITNLRDEDVLIGCSRSGEFNLWVQKDGETIWALAHWFKWYSPGVELSAGESIEIPHNWDMKDDNSNLVEPGIYDVVGVMYNEPWNYYNHGTPIITKVAVPIKVVPEPKGRVKHN